VVAIATLIAAARPPAQLIRDVPPGGSRTLDLPHQYVSPGVQAPKTKPAKDAGSELRGAHISV
jgi:hypothetical protein